MDNHLKKQLEKPQTWFCKYFPKRIRNVGEKEVADRQMVYDFKDGRSFEAVAQMTAASLKEQYGDGCKDITFVPVPASTSEKNELRYKAFCERVLRTDRSYQRLRPCKGNRWVALPSTRTASWRRKSAR